MDSIRKLISDKKFAQPEEIDQLKRYIDDHYGSSSEIHVSSRAITVIVPNGALATSLRLSMPAIKKELGISQKIAIRIG